MNNFVFVLIAVAAFASISVTNASNLNGLFDYTFGSTDPATKDSFGKRYDIVLQSQTAGETSALKLLLNKEAHSALCATAALLVDANGTSLAGSKAKANWVKEIKEAYPNVYGKLINLFFNTADKNGNAELSEDEFENAIKAINSTALDANKWFKKMDKLPGDGVLTLGEILANTQKLNDLVAMLDSIDPILRSTWI